VLIIETSMWAAAERILEHLGAAARTLTTLTIELACEAKLGTGGIKPPATLLQPLRSLAKLQTLRYIWQEGEVSSFGAQAIAVFESLPVLTDLDAFNNEPTIQQLQLLAGEVSTLWHRLVSLDMRRMPVVDAVAAALPWFTALTTIDTDCIMVADPIFLHAFVRCKRAVVYCSDDVDIDLLIPILSEFTVVKTLLDAATAPTPADKTHDHGLSDDG
jgi:hypothetical protein